jgi:prolipoprotein diacylglyceryltransferase
LLWLLTKAHNDGEIAGMWLFLGGIACFLFEFVRGGRGTGLFDGTQIASLLMIVLGAILLMDRKRSTELHAPGNEDNNAL